MSRKLIASVLAVSILILSAGTLASGRASVQAQYTQYIYLAHATADGTPQGGLALTGFRIRDAKEIIDAKRIITAQHGVANVKSIAVYSPYEPRTTPRELLKIVKVDASHDLPLLSSSELEERGDDGLAAQKRSGIQLPSTSPLDNNPRAAICQIAQPRSNLLVVNLNCVNAEICFKEGKNPKTYININAVNYADIIYVPHTALVQGNCVNGEFYVSEQLQDRIIKKVAGINIDWNKESCELDK